MLWRIKCAFCVITLAYLHESRKIIQITKPCHSEGAKRPKKPKKSKIFGYFAYAQYDNEKGIDCFVALCAPHNDDFFLLSILLAKQNYNSHFIDNFLKGKIDKYSKANESSKNFTFLAI